MGRVAAALALAAIVLAQGCGREAPRTAVTPPRHSLPDATVLKPSTGATPTAPPATASSAPVVTAEEARSTQPAPLAAQPGPRPAEPNAPVAVRNVGDAEGARWLAERSLMVPVVGVPPASLMDNYEQKRGQGLHEAIDIVAKTGTPVVAVDDGKIAKLFTSKPGGLTVYQFDPQGRLSYYYAHLAGYANGLKEGMEVKRGDVIGYVGFTGNADPKTPHLHFAIFKLGPARNWWQGDPINPYPALRRGVAAEMVTAGK